MRVSFEASVVDRRFDSFRVSATSLPLRDVCVRAAAVLLALSVYFGVPQAPRDKDVIRDFGVRL